MATTDATMRAVYRFVSMWLFITDSLAAPIQIQLIEEERAEISARVFLMVADVDQARAWLNTFTRAGFRLRGAQGTSPGYVCLALIVEGVLFGHQVTIIVQCPALRSVPRDIQDRVEA